MAAHKYDVPVDLSVDSTHRRVIRLVGERKRVLELGCATGSMTRVLVERFGCTVTGIERDAEAAEQARKVCHRVIVADVESPDWPRPLGEERFDVVVCADVLEHLRDPVRALAGVRPFLAPVGYVVASIPNIAHASVIAELLEGRFRYRPTGLLDETHLRFFTRESIYDCFERAGFTIAHLDRFRAEPEQTEFRTDLSRFAPAVADAIRAHEESTTYQFILVAHPTTAGPLDVLREALARVGVTDGATPAPAAAGDPAAPLEGEPDRRRDRVTGLVEALLGRLGFLVGRAWAGLTGAARRAGPGHERPTS